MTATALPFGRHPLLQWIDGKGCAIGITAGRQVTTTLTLPALQGRNGVFAVVGNGSVKSQTNWHTWTRQMTLTTGYSIQRAETLGKSILKRCCCGFVTWRMPRPKSHTHPDIKECCRPCVVVSCWICFSIVVLSPLLGMSLSLLPL